MKAIGPSFGCIPGECVTNEAKPSYSALALPTLNLAITCYTLGCAEGHQHSPEALSRWQLWKHRTLSTSVFQIVIQEVSISIP